MGVLQRQVARSQAGDAWWWTGDVVPLVLNRDASEKVLGASTHQVLVGDGRDPRWHPSASDPRG